MKTKFTFLMIFIITIGMFIAKPVMGQTTYQTIFWDNHVAFENVPYCTCDSIKCVPPAGAMNITWFASGATETYHGDTLVLESGFDGQVTCFYTGGPKGLLLRPLSAPTVPSFLATQTVCGIQMVTLDAENYSLYSFNQYAWSNGATTQTITVGAGNYIATITNVCGSITHSATITEFNANAPDLGPDMIVSQGSTVPLDPGTGYSDYLWLPGNSMDTILYPTISGTYTVETTNTSDGCVDRDTIQVTFLTPPSQEIDLLTMDTTNGNIRVVWSDIYPEGEFIDIYREITTNNYQLVGTAPYTAETWTDTVDSRNQAWRYKIAVVDTFGNEGSLSPWVQSIHVWVTANVGGGYTIQWTALQFESNKEAVQQYNIYGGSQLSQLAYLAFVSGNVTVYTLTGFVDSLYVVGAQLSAKGIQTDALSNWVSEHDITGITENTLAEKIKVYPTLTNGPITIETDLTIKDIIAYSSIGQYAMHIKDKYFILPNKGQYIITIVTDEGTMTVKILVQ